MGLHPYRAALQSPPPGRYRPARLDPAPADSVDDLVQMDHNTHMVWDKPDLLAHHRPPAAVPEIQNAVLLREPLHRHLRPVDQGRESILRSGRRLPAERFGTGVDHRLTGHGCTHNSGQHGEGAIVPGTGPGLFG